MLSIPPAVVEEFREQLRRPRGSFAFRATVPALFDPDHPPGVLWEISAGAHAFMIDRSEQFTVRAFHSSPGTGTRVAEIDLKALTPDEQVTFVFTWSPEATTFWMGAAAGTDVVSAEGGPSAMQLAVGKGGSIYRIGDVGIKVEAVFVNQGGTMDLAPSAIEAWHHILGGIDTIGRPSDGDFQYEVAVSNLSFVLLVTGFETYCRTRFLELPKEGLEPDYDRLAQEFLRVYQRDSDGGWTQFESDAAEQGVLLAEAFAELINFQNWERAKAAYSRGHGLLFGHLGVDAQTLERVQRVISVRHRVVHDSPFLPILNPETAPPDEIQFANFEAVARATADMSQFVDALHEATLRIEQ